VTWSLCLIIIGLLLDAHRPKGTRRRPKPQPPKPQPPTSCICCAPRIRAAERMAAAGGRIVRFGSRVCPSCQRSVPLLGAVVTSSPRR